MYLQKVLENTASIVCKILDRVVVLWRLMHPEMDLFEPGYHVERSGMSQFGPGHDRIEPEVGLAEPCSVTCASEVIRFEC
jgi:hypothetical protein